MITSFEWSRFRFLRKLGEGLVVGLVFMLLCTLYGEPDPGPVSWLRLIALVTTPLLLWLMYRFLQFLLSAPTPHVAAVLGIGLFVFYWAWLEPWVGWFVLALPPAMYLAYMYDRRRADAPPATTTDPIDSI